MQNKEELLENFEEDPTFGGPALIDVTVDNGKDGQRGASFFLSAGNPNNPLTPPLLSYPDFENPPDLEDPLGNLISVSSRTGTAQRYDVCIDVNPISPTYLDLFYYYDGPEGLKWYDELRLTPEGYPYNVVLEFDENGTTVLDFPSVPAPPVLANIIAAASVSTGFNLDLFLSILKQGIKKNLNIHYNILNQHPVAPVIYPYGLDPVSVGYGFVATIEEGKTIVKLDSGNILDLSVGDKLFKIEGSGEFDSLALISEVPSPTGSLDIIPTGSLDIIEFTVDKPHTVSGQIIFSVEKFEGSVSTATGQERRVVLINGNTADLSVGQKVFKSSGTGNFGVDAIITRILSPTTFTVSSNTIDSGTIKFGATLPNIDIILGISALTYQANNWLPLTGTKTVHTLAGIVPFNVSDIQLSDES
jgi:hypothetical protein